MRKTLLAILALLALCLSAQASTLINATITVTNVAGTTNGQTVAVNGDTRTWTNSVQVPAAQILTNSTIGGAATNLFNQVADSPFANLNLALSGTNGITLQTVPNGALTVTLSPGWGLVVFTTNQLASAISLRLPLSTELAGQQTNLASMLATALESSTNPLSATDILLGNYLSLSQAQTITGAKTLNGQVIATNTGNVFSGTGTNLSNLQGTVGFLTNGYYTNPIIVNPTMSNAVNQGFAFNSPGSGANSIQLGQAATAGGNLAIALGYSAFASGSAGMALGAEAEATGPNSTAAGTFSTASGTNSTALGQSATASGTNSTAIGSFATSAFANSTAIGSFATSTAANQLMLAAPGVGTVVNNYLQVLGGATFSQAVTNLQHFGTNTFLAGSDIAFEPLALSSLATGANAAIPVGTNVYVELSGPGGAFSIAGINGSPNRNGKYLILVNRTGQNMTISHQSGTDATAGNRIICLTSADKTVTGNSSAFLVYNGAAARWICLYFGQ